MKTITLRLDDSDLKAFEDYKSRYGATRTAMIRLLAKILKSPESTRAFLDLAADSQAENN